MARHDQLFKTLFRTFFADLVHLTAPSIAPRLDLSSVRFHDKEIFNDPPRGRRSELDLLAAAPLTARAGESKDAKAWILVHVEIEGAYRRSFAARFWRYFVHLRLRYPDKPILPIVVFIRGGPPGLVESTYEERVLDEPVLRFTYRSLGLSGGSAQDFLDQPWPLAWALAALMRARPLSPAEHKIACLRPIVQASLDDAERWLLLETVETYLPLHGDESERYHRTVEFQEPEILEMDRAFPERWLAEGRAEGLARGRAEGEVRGRAQGLRTAVTQLLERRFGPLSAALRQRLERVEDPDELAQLNERALDGCSLEELGLSA